MLRIPTAFLLAALLPAQRTWTVDAAGGPGTDFVDLPPAVLAAGHGDTILVRPARTAYQATTIDKGLRVVATAPGATLAGQALRIAGLAAGRRATISGFSIDPTSSYVVVDQCAGSICLDALAGGLSRGTLIQVFRARAVLIQGCWVENGRGEALFVNDSDVWVTDSIVRGLDALPPTDSVIGIQAVNSRLSISHSTVSGGRALATPGVHAPAMSLWGGEAVVGGRSTIAGGGAIAVASPSSARLVLDPATTVIGAVQGSVTVVPMQLPTLSRAENGTEMRYDGVPGDLVAVYLSVPRVPVTTPFGQLWIDPAASVLLQLGAVDPLTGALRSPYARLRIPGADISVQAIGLRQSSVRLSTPLHVVMP